MESRMTVFLIITLIFIFSFLAIHKIPDKRIKNISKIVLIVIALEIYVFNINSFRMILKNYKQETYTQNQVKMTGIKYNEKNGTYELEMPESVIEIENLNTEVATIKLNIEILNNNKLDYKIGYMDETSTAQYRELPKKVLVNEVEKSKIVVCYLSGNSKNIKICFEQDKNFSNTVIKINDITVNKEVNLFENISLSRILVLAIILILIYFMLTEKVFNRPYDKKNGLQSVVLLMIIVLFIVINEWITMTTGHIKTEIYDKFVNALLNGQVSLLKEPSKQLLSLPNPYDSTLRDEKHVNYIWDVALYNNKYYVYFGILPFLILPVPLKALFGIQISTKVGILLFSIIAIVALSKLIILLYKRWFKELSFNYLILAIIGTLSGSLIFWINRRPDVYEFALSAALCFSTLGLYFFFKAIEMEQKVKYRYLTLSAICLALTVACRPNHILVSLIVIPELIKILRQNIKQRHNIAKLICAVGIPYLTVGVMLMIYNYVRFDNIFEFGAKYQLTVNDMTNLKNRIMAIPVGLVTQLFAMPSVTSTFPFFIHKAETAISFQGYYYVFNYVCGLFILNPINYILIFLYRLKKKIKEKQAYNYIILLTIVAFIICIVNIVLAGTLQRYSMDYAWILNITSYLTLFMIVSNIKSEEIKKYILRMAIAVTMFMFIINFVVGGLVSEIKILEINNPQIYYKIRYLVCFWE